MVLGVLSPVEEKKSNEKSRQTVDERAPLLPPVYCDSDNVECDEFNRASFSGAVFNLSTTVVGAGIMGLPAAMKLLGIGPGIAIIIFMAFLTEFSIKIMLKFSKPANSVTYSGLMRDSFGRTGEIALQICIIINNVGTLVVFMIIIDSLRYTSALSVALAVVFVIITTGIVTMKFLNGSTEMPRFLPNVTDVASFLKLFTAVPVLVTAYICHYNVHPITKELEDNSEMQSIVRISLILCMVVYTTTSFFCFLLFGESTLDDVLANFDVDLGIPYSSFLTSILRICYAIHLMLVAPIAFFGLRLNLDELLFPSARPLVLDNKRFTLINMALIAFIFIGANFIPSIWDAFQFTGATSGVCMGFIFPGAVALRDQHGIATKKDKILGIFMVVLAVFSSTVAIYSDANSMFKKNNGSLRA
ncbi:sodium-coupled neutral amino acid transporter 1 isoform X3 [Amborella trichopoda]|uniref:sodium-coupled neutral amino acid transporter 1 isoform X3 n=1 Tax=Amborella trichopoda TaxID=13333 RepID=UPI0009BF0824|nr:sodium-coupled neutral amino acid transporter 1 isoform X3 [Amborella trichopoda]|eukprot:XP_020522698.1 sodium-coupled neutral amino acid transporter 1 isoform X3 [Amborella trichopoda]